MAGGAREHGSCERLAALVHDLRTPLAIVLGFGEMLEKTADELTPDQRQDYIRRISAAAAEMRDLLDAQRSSRQARG